MATNTLTSKLTALQVGEKLGSGRMVMDVIDILSEKLIYRDAHWVEANDRTVHHYLQTLSEPEGSDSVYNVGVAWEIGLDSPVTEILQGLETYSRVDVRLLEDSGDPTGLRKNLDAKAIRGLSKGVDSRVFYGNTTIGKHTAISASQILGLAPRFNSLSPTYNQIQGTQYWPIINVQSAGGSTANAQASAWTFKWGDDGVFMLYPRDGKKFVEARTLNPQVITDANGNAVEYEITHFSIGFGIGIGDWRNVTRLANINVATDAKPWTSDTELNLMACFPDGADGRDNVQMYVDRKTWVSVQQEAKSNANSFHFDDAPWGGITPWFMTIPISVADELVDTEPVVV